LRNQREVDWVSYLKHRIAHDARQFAALKPKWPHVITFNYDRSFEELMFQRLRHHFEDAHAAPDMVAKLLRQWQIVHVHGSLGDHPAFTEDRSGRFFERTQEHEALEAAIRRITLVDDAKEDSRNSHGRES
jgi:hypothetical protein